MLNKVSRSCFVILLTICWLEPGSSGPVGPAGPARPLREDHGLDSLALNLHLKSQKDSEGKWHHIIGSVSDLPQKMGLRAGQELLLIRPTSTSEGIPCVGRSRDVIMRALRSIEFCKKFTIVVSQENGQVFKMITGFIGRRGNNGPQGQPGPGGYPGVPGPGGSETNVRVAISWAVYSLLGIVSSPQWTETVFIQPYIFPSQYMKNEGGNITFAALRNEPDWKFTKMIYLNFTALLKGDYELHTVFKTSLAPNLFHTQGEGIALLASDLTAAGTPSQLFHDNTFLQHSVDPYSQLNYYEPLNHRGKYIAFDISSRHLKLEDTHGFNTMFYTKDVNTNTEGSRGEPGQKGPGGPGGRDYLWSYSDECDAFDGYKDRSPPGGPRGPLGPSY